MKAQVIRENGTPDVFNLEDMAQPTPESNQVLIRIKASSVNTADLMARSMGPVVNFIPTPPAVLGMDFAGVVEAVGQNVQGYAVGDEVYGCAGGVAHHQGTLAQYMVADPQLIAHKPQSLSMEEAAALPLVAITAFEALFDRMRLSSGQKILIHGGAGGVGHIAIQMALSVGATVYATDHGAARLEAIQKLGATPIDYLNESVEDYVGQYTDGEGFDMIFDTVGGPNIPTSLNAVKLNGQVATTVSIGDVDLTMAHLKGATLHVIYMLIPMIHGQGTKRHGEILNALTTLVQSEQLRPIVDTIYPLEEAAQAHQRLESRQAMGKVVVRID